MPDTTTAPADGTTGTQTPAATPPAEGQGGGTPPAGRTFTQAELDAIVQDRVARAKPADYDEAAAALAREKARAEGEKSDLQKAQDAQRASDEKATAAERRAEEALRTSEIRIEALKQGADEELVALALSADSSVEVKDGKVVGAKEAVEKLLERKPNLKIGASRQSGGEFGGTDGSTVHEQIIALEAKGDKDSMAQARRLKIAQQLAGNA